MVIKLTSLNFNRRRVLTLTKTKIDITIDPYPPVFLLGGLYRFTDYLVGIMHLKSVDTDIEILKAITKPFTKTIVKVGKGKIGPNVSISHAV